MSKQKTTAVLNASKIRSRKKRQRRVGIRVNSVCGKRLILFEITEIVDSHE